MNIYSKNLYKPKQYGLNFRSQFDVIIQVNRTFDMFESDRESEIS